MEMTTFEAIVIIKRDYKDIHRGVFCTNDFAALDTLVDSAKEYQLVKADIKALGNDLRLFRDCIADPNTLKGFNMAVAICNKYLADKGGSCDI